MLDGRCPGAVVSLMIRIQVWVANGVKLEHSASRLEEQHHADTQS
jgi:hypothetical protein